MSTQNECSPIPCPRHQPWTPDQLHAYLRDVRQDLLSGDPARRSDGLRRLYLELADGGEVGFECLGHVARVDGREGFEAGMIELVFCLGFPDEWPR